MDPNALATNESNPTAQQANTVKDQSWPAVFACALLVWVLSFLGPLSIALLPLMAWMCWLLTRRRCFRELVVFVLITPIGLSAAQGAIGYARGTAALRGSGYPGTRFHNLDPELRCGRVTYGCIVTGNEWVSQWPYNTMVWSLTKSFGYMRNTYTGPYPTDEQVSAALLTALKVSWADLKQDQIPLGNETVSLDKGVGERLISKVRRFDDITERKESDDDSARATLWQSECLILRIPVTIPLEREHNSAVIVLISRKTGRPFAYYAEGDYHHNFSPVSWHRTSDR